MTLQTESIVPAGQGDFGDVYLARCHGYGRPEDQDSIVMVKSLLQPRDDAALSQFAHEAELFGKVAAHVNVARLLALVKDSEPHLLVMQYSDWVSRQLISFLICFYFAQAPISNIK